LPASNGAEGYLLQVNLDEFTQAFSTPTASQCIVQVRAELWGPDDQTIAQREFRLVSPAPTPDASGEGRCLAAAVDTGSEQIVEWLKGAVAKTP
jgi:ABC-type uncharacterized transport system auxiliary subunit